MAPLSLQEMGLALQSIMTDHQWKILEENGAAAFSHTPDVGGQGLRVSVLMDGSQLRVAAQPLQWDDPDAAPERTAG
jgi:hypothetical protein